jgi:long-chain acyl-CoA synthetase
VVVVLDPELDPDVVAVRLRDSEAGLLIAWHALAEAAERVSMIGAIECLFVEPREFSRLLAGVSPRVALDDRDAGAPAVLVYSSAGAIPADRVAFTHGELIAGARRLARSASLEPADIVLCAPSLGLEIDPGFAMNAVVETGASLVLLGDRPTPALTAASTEKATVLIGEAGAIAALFAAGRGARKTTAVPRIFVPVGASRPSELNVEPREVDQMTIPKASAAS